MADYYIVVKHFKDGEDNGRYYPVNSKYPITDDIEVTEDRLNLLTEKGYIKKVKKQTVPLDEHTVKELKEIADNKGIEYDPKIKKADLIALLKE